MHKYIIERAMPGAGKLTTKDLCDVSAKSNGVLRELGPDVQWVHSYVTEDKVTCVYLATNADIIREHARRAGIPVDSVNEVRAVIDPATADAR